MKRWIGLLLAVSLQGCIYLPKTDTVYDEDCKTYTRQMTLQPTQVGYIGGCHGRDCAYLLAAMGVITAGSVVVSGSIVVVGNVAYWIEKQGTCLASRLGGT
jgi:hypothetical protein